MAVIGLSSAGRRALEGIVTRSKDVRQYRRAQAWLWLAEGERATAVAQRLRVHRDTIYAWAARYRQRGQQRVPVRLLDRARAGRPRRLAERVEQVLVSVLEVVPISARVPGAGAECGDHATLPASPGLPLEASALCAGAALTVLAPGEGGLKCGLKHRHRTVILMVDETFILETPPLRASWAKVGVQAEVPISGNHARRVIHGALNVMSGHVEFLSTDHWTAATYQAFLRHIRQAWRGWHIVLFIDRGSPHTAKASRVLATTLGIEVRWLPTATPELNACEGLWRGAKGAGLANRASHSIDEAADAACRYLLDLTPRQRLQLAGVLSGHFWLAT